MKKVLFFLLVLSLSLPTWAQKEMSTVDFALEYGDKTLAPSINMFTHVDLLKYFSITALVSLDDPLAEAYLGLSVKPFEWLVLGAGRGLEFCEINPLAPANQEFSGRYLGNLWFGTEKFSFLGLFGQGVGKDNYLYKASLIYNISEEWSAGLVAWRFHGLGIKGQYKFIDLPLTAFVFPAYDLDSKSFKASIGISLDISRESLYKE